MSIPFATEFNSLQGNNSGLIKKHDSPEQLVETYDKNLFKSLLEDINYREPLDKIKNTNILVLLQEIYKLLKKPEFISFFSQVIDLSMPNFPPREIFEVLSKHFKLGFESQFKLIISYLKSSKEKFKQEGLNLFTMKSHELFNSIQDEKVSIEMIHLLLSQIKTNEIFKNDNFLKTSFFNYLMEIIKSNEISKSNEDDFETYIQSESKEIEGQEIERLLTDFAAFSISQQKIECKLDEKRFCMFLLFFVRHNSWTEDPTQKNLNNLYFKVLKENLDIDDPKVSFNFPNFLKFIRSSPLFNNLDMNKLISCFDDSGFKIRDKKSFDYFNSLLSRVRLPPNITSYLITNCLTKKWNNEFNQIEFISFLVNNPVECFSFKSCQRKVQKVYELTINKPNSAHLIDAWSSIDLIEVLIKLSKGSYFSMIKELFNWPIENIPEIIVTGLFQLKIDITETLFQEIVNNLLQLFLGNHLNSLVVLEEIWNINKDLLIKTICGLYMQNQDLMNLSKILDISQKIKDSLIPFATCNDHNFTVNFAILAVKRDFLHIDQWLAERIKTVGDDFIMALLNYIKINIIDQCKDITTSSLHKESLLEKCQLTIESIAIIFENLNPNKIRNNPKVSKQCQQEIALCYKSVFEIFEELQIHPANSEEIEDSANKLLHGVFVGETEIQEFIEILKKYKVSNDHNETEIYACVIHGLLDEYRFLAKYPDNELKIMSVLFGQLINTRLLDGFIENIALKYVIEGIKKASGKMYVFGTTALEQYIDKLGNWPEMLYSLYTCNFLRKSHAQMYDKINNLYEDYLKKNKFSEFKPPNDLPNLINPNHLIEDLKAHSTTSNYEAFDEKNQKGSSSKKLINEEDFYPNQNINNFNKFPNFNHPPHIQNYNQMNFPPQKPNDNFQGIPHHLAGLMKPQQQPQTQQQPPKLLFPHQEQPPTNFPSFIMNQENPRKIPPIFKPQIPADGESYMIENRARFRNDLENDKSREENIFGEENTNFTNAFNDKSQNQSKLKIIQSNQSKNLLSELIKNDKEFFISSFSPPQEIVNKINFAFNTMTKSNINEKSNEIKILITQTQSDNIARWYSNYFIMNRVPNEINNLLIYNDLITNINNKELSNLLIKDTILIIRKLLSLETVKENTERTYLKNFGSWLGIMTLAKNKPIITRLLDLKQILFDAYENGKLITVIPLMTKILEHSAKTKVFHPKNPWILVLLKILNEIYNKKGLKQNLIYEIEGLFKKLDVENLPESKYLEKLIVCNNSTDFTNENKISNQTNLYNDFYTTFSNVNLERYLNEFQIQVIKICEGLGLTIPIKKEDLLKTLAQSLFNAIVEILNPIVERAVNISLITTKELIFKDFAFEKDEKVIKQAAITCIKSLSSSLSIVTCKDALKNNFLNQLKETFKKNYRFGDELNHERYYFNHSELLEIGYVFIQNNVIIKAIDKIENDANLSEEITKRKSPEYEIKKELYDKIKNLPSVLRPSKLSQSNDLARIYEDFEKNSIFLTGEINKKSNFIKIIVPAIKECLNSIKNSNANLLSLISSYELCLKNIELLLKNEGIDISKEGDDLLGSISKLIIESKINKNLALELVNSNLKFIILSANLNNSSLLLIYLEIMKGWTKLHPVMAKEYTNKILTYNNYFTKFNFKIHSLSLRKEIFDLEEYEKMMLEYIEDPLHSNFARKLLMMLIDDKVILVSDLKIIPDYKIDSQTYFDLFQLQKKQTQDRYELTDYKLFNLQSETQYLEYVNYARSSYTEIKQLFMFNKQDKQEEIQEFYKKFNKTPFAQLDEQLIIYLMIIFESELQEFFNQENSDKLDFSYFDYFTNFLVRSLILIENNDKIKLLENILISIFRIFHLVYTKNPQSFNQRPFYRIILHLCYLLNNYIINDIQFKFHIFNKIAEFLELVCPENYPGFTFAWMDIVSSKFFISNFLENDRSNLMNRKYKKYCVLVSLLLNFLSSVSKEGFKDESVRIFLNYSTKFFYSLSKSFPEFLAYNYLYFINLIPYNCFNQIRNIIVSSMPMETELKDPFSGDFNFDTITDNKKVPAVLFDINSLAAEIGEGFKFLLDSYCEHNEEAKLRAIIDLINKKKEQKNIHKIINVITVYFINRLLLNFKDKGSDAGSKIKELLDIFSKFIYEFDKENLDIFLNALLNEIRYPNKITYLISKFYLKFLTEIKIEGLEEHMMKNLMERLIIKPNPWGILITFLEINKFYKINNSNWSQITNNPNSYKLVEKVYSFTEKSRYSDFENYIV